MYAKIKELADEAVALQNKNRMDEVLREISASCQRAMESNSYAGPALASAITKMTVTPPAKATKGGAK